MQFGIFFFVLSLNKQFTSDRYCIPMDSARPILSSELEFFNKGTGKGESRSQITCFNTNG